MLFVFLVLLLVSRVLAERPCAPQNCLGADLVPEFVLVATYLINLNNWTISDYGVIETDLSRINDTDTKRMVGHIAACASSVGGFIVKKHETWHVAAMYAWEADVLSIIVAGIPPSHYIKL